jgi:hypothetical protein
MDAILNELETTPALGATTGGSPSPRWLNPAADAGDATPAYARTYVMPTLEAVGWIDDGVPPHIDTLYNTGQVRGRLMWISGQTGDAGRHITCSLTQDDRAEKKRAIDRARDEIIRIAAALGNDRGDSALRELAQIDNRYGLRQIEVEGAEDDSPLTRLLKEDQNLRGHLIALSYLSERLANEEIPVTISALSIPIALPRVLESSYVTNEPWYGNPAAVWRGLLTSEREFIRTASRLEPRAVRERIYRHQALLLDIQTRCTGNPEYEQSLVGEVQEAERQARQRVTTIVDPPRHGMLAYLRSWWGNRKARNEAINEARKVVRLTVRLERQWDRLLLN